MKPSFLNIKKQSDFWSFRISQELPISIKEAWSFFTNPSNLLKITPPELALTITSTPTINIHAGQIISYKINILPFISSKWVSEITHVELNNYFIDEQRIGPYRLWHHEHYFFQLEKSVIVTDNVFYMLPAITPDFFKIIRAQLNNIFLFRYLQLEDIFC